MKEQSFINAIQHVLFDGWDELVIAVKYLLLDPLLVRVAIDHFFGLLLSEVDDARATDRRRGSEV